MLDGKKDDILKIDMANNVPRSYEEYCTEAAILDYEINSKGVQNIAVSAVYGAGKSSVIKTYLEGYRAKKPDSYVNIALAGFADKEPDNVEIERSILQQLLYSVRSSVLPNSKIERTEKTSLLKSTLSALCITAFVVCIVVLICYALNIVALPGSIFAAIAATASVILFLILLYMLHKHKLRKIKYKDLEADFVNGEKNDNAQHLINKFLDEVLYFFECSNVDLVIFEDIDRLAKNGLELIIKLRELNTLINNSKNCSRKVVFLYAVRDDLFEAGDRAKFFDFILRLPAVVNPLTVMERLSEATEKLKGSKQCLSERLIRNIATYIPDMRILTNTLNDYKLFYVKLNGDGNNSPHAFENDKLFALCLYKNLYPKDYALLEQKNEGVLAAMLDRVKIKESAIRLAKSNGYKQNLSKGVEWGKEFAEKLERAHVTFKEMLEYFDYEKLFAANVQGACAKIDGKSQVKEAMLDFIGFLIRRDFIDEGYLNYISPINYYSVSAKEMQFIMKIRAGKIDREFRFDNVERAIGYMSEEDFLEEGILNYDILSSFDVISRERQKLENITSLLMRNNDSVAKCVQDFILHSENEVAIETFFNYIVPKRKMIVFEVLSTSGMQEWKKQAVIATLLDKCDGFVEYNIDDAITKYLSSDKFEWGCIINCGDSSKIKDLIKVAKAKFVDLNNCPQDLVEYVKANSYYAVNISNLLLLTKGGLEGNFFNENYTIISQDINIKKYIDVHLDAYAEVLLDADIAGIGDETEILSRILKDKNIALDKKEGILKKFELKITNIAEYDQSIHTSILKYDRMEATWGNVAKACNATSEILKEYILNPERRIDGNITNEDAARLYRAFSKFKMEDAECVMLKRMIANITNKCNLHDVIDDDTNDVALELLIDNDKVSFGSADWQYLQKYKMAKATYCKKYEESIEQRVGDFFKITQRNVYGTTIVVSNAAKELLQVLNDDCIGIVIKNCLVSATYQKIQLTKEQYKKMGEISLNLKGFILPQAWLEQVVSLCEENNSKVRHIANRIEADKNMKKEEVEVLVKHINGWNDMLSNAQAAVRITPYSAVKIIVDKFNQGGAELQLTRGKKNHDEAIVRMA